MKHQQTIVHRGFNIDIVGPLHETKAKREQVRKLPPKRRLKEIKRAAWLAVKAKLPPGFSALHSFDSG
jgi:hypothetical protein